MKHTFIIVAALLVANVSTGAEIYAGHSVRGMSPATSDEVVGFLVGDRLKAGAWIFGRTPYAHVIAETEGKNVFAGVGIGIAAAHPHLDGLAQFTLTAGVKFGQLKLRWMHMSNGADIFNRHNKAARNRNLGVDFLTIGCTF